MAKFTLTKCKLREDKFVKEAAFDSFSTDWDQLVERLAPSKTKEALMNLRQLQPGAFVGLARDKNNPENIRNFVLLNTDRSAKLDWVLKKDPSFEDRLIEVYKVEHVQLDATVLEMGPAPK